jgi:hypothetical protein
MMDSLLEPPMQEEVAAWEKSIRNEVVAWTVLDPVSFNSSNGTTFARQSDGSLLAEGKRPETDTCIITAQTGLKDITAVRLEVLADDSLPHKGPGRQDNGNLHLSEFKVFATAKIPPPGAPVSEPARNDGSPHAGSETGAPVNGAGGPRSKPLVLQNPSADFDQSGWTIAHAIDGKEKTAWGIHPQVGQSHFAVFELRDNLGFDGGTALTFVLEQLHGGGHLIGRPRLSVTTAARPVRARPFPESITQILLVPAGDRTEVQRMDLAAFHLQGRIDTQLAALPKPRFVYAGASDFAPDGGLVPAKAPRPIHVLKRGDVTRPGAEAFPGALSAVTALQARFALTQPADEGSRRAALANWIVAPENPLTWRAIVNRVWHHHFGRGIVDSPNDFGRMGGRPSHPELLDWLAGWFRDHGGSFKQLHRLIVMSAAYRQSAQDQPAFARLDADNRLLWRMNRTRLDAECARDAILQITGQLDLTMGGPSVKQFTLSPGIHVTPVVDYAKFDVDSVESRRRSIYRFLFRTLPDPFMDSLDCPEASQLAPVRGGSVTALQALAMWNNHFVVRQSEHFAERVARMEPPLRGQIEAAYQLALGRAPSRREAKELLDYARRHGMANLCRLILNSNEFMFVN